MASPPGPEQLAGFPARVYPAGTALYRCHRLGRNPWWFGSAGSGRFDLAEPSGTCYLAESAVVALLETWGGLAIVPAPLADARAVAALSMSDKRIADATDNRAVAFGITAELATTVDYSMT